VRRNSLEEPVNASSRGEDNEAREEFKDAARETAGRIAARSVHLRGNETPRELAEIEEAIERFEAAVESHGGDLMVDEAPRGQRGQPDDPRFLLPKRTATMSVADYLVLLSRAIDGIRRKR
jgi:hypothetical protein